MRGDLAAASRAATAREQSEQQRLRDTDDFREGVAAVGRAAATELHGAVARGRSARADRDRPRPFAPLGDGRAARSRLLRSAPRSDRRRPFEHHRAPARRRRTRRSSCAARRCTACSPTAHDMGREYRHHPALGPTPVPVPQALALLRRRRRDRRAVLRHVVRRRHRAARHRRRRAAARRGSRRAHAGAVARRRARRAARGRRRRGRARRPRPARRARRRQLKRWHAQFEASKTRRLPTVDRVHDAARRHASPTQTREHGRARRLPARELHRRRATATCGRCSTGRSARSATRCADVGYVLATWAEPGDPLRADDHEPDARARLHDARRPARALRGAVGARRVGDRRTSWPSRSGGSPASSRACSPRILAGARGDGDADVDSFRGRVESCAQLAEEYARVSDRRPKGARRADHAPAVTVAGYSHVAVMVDDLDAALAFYCDIARASPCSPGPTSAPGTEGAWLTARPRPGAPRRRRGDGAAYRLPAHRPARPADAWDDTMRELEARGVCSSSHRAREDFGKTVRGGVHPRSSRQRRSSSPTSIPPEPPACPSASDCPSGRCSRSS